MGGTKPGSHLKRKQLRRNCMIHATMAKLFIFVTEAETCVKSSKQLKISTNGLFRSDLRNGGPFPGQSKQKIHVSYDVSIVSQPLHSRSNNGMCVRLLLACLAFLPPSKVRPGM